MFGHFCMTLCAFLSCLTFIFPKFTRRRGIGAQRMHRGGSTTRGASPAPACLLCPRREALQGPVSGLHALPPAGVSLPPPSWGRWVSSHPWTPVWTLCVLRKSRGRGWSQEGQELGLQARATGNRAERGQPHEPVCYFQPLPPDMCDLHAQLQTHHVGQT